MKGGWQDLFFRDWSERLKSFSSYFQVSEALDNLSHRWQEEVEGTESMYISAHKIKPDVWKYPVGRVGGWEYAPILFLWKESDKAMNMNHHFPDLGGRGSCSDYFHKSLYVCLFMGSKRETFFFFLLLYMLYRYCCSTKGAFCLFFDSFQRYWIISYTEIASPSLYFMLFQLTVHKRISPTFQDFAQDSSANKWTPYFFVSSSLTSR